MQFCGSEAAGNLIYLTNTPAWVCLRTVQRQRRSPDPNPSNVFHMKCVSRLSAHNNLSAFRGTFTWAHLSQERRMTRSPRRRWLDSLRRTEKEVYRSQCLTSEQPTPHPAPSVPGGRGRAACVRQVFLQTQVSADGCIHECCWRSLYALVCIQRALSVTITFIRFQFYYSRLQMH